MRNTIKLLFSLLILIIAMGIFSIFKKPNKNIDLDKILKNKRSDLAIMEIDEHLNKLSNYCEDIEKLNKSQKILIIIENLEQEINNGGFHQFYFNSSGDFANETVEYLKIIKAEKTANIVTTANKQWENGIVPKDRTERQIALETIEIKAKPIWEQCDNNFYKYQDNIAELLIEFVKQNRIDFE